MGSRTVMELLRKQTAEAQAAKNRAQQHAWKLRERLQDEAESARSEIIAQKKQNPSALRGTSSRACDSGSRRNIERDANARSVSVRRPVRIPGTSRPPKCFDVSTDSASVTDDSTVCASVRSACTVSSSSGNCTAASSDSGACQVSEDPVVPSDARHRRAWPGEVILSGESLASSPATFASGAEF